MSDTQKIGIQKIVQINFKNTMRLKDVNIFPEGNLIAVGGNNAQGKTSLLETISSTLGGAKRLCERPILDGKTAAESEIELTDFIVTRRVTQTGTTLDLRTKEGVKIPSGQTVLDKLCGDLTFDPSEFARMEAKKQLEALRKLVGIDFSELDAKQATHYVARATVNRDVKTLEGKVAGLQFDPKLSAEEVDGLAIAEELKAAIEKNVANSKARNLSRYEEHVKFCQSSDADYADAIENTLKEIETLKAKVADLTVSRAANQVTLAAAQDDLAAREAEVTKLVDIDQQEITNRLLGVNAVNDKIRINKRAKEIREELKKKNMESEQLTQNIEVIDQEKREQLEAAKFPIKEISFDDSGVLLNKLPFNQGSDAEKLRASVAMGMALNPTLRVMLVRNGSLFDERNLALLSEMATANDYQIWVERVGKGKECQVIIEDGKVEGAL